MGNLRYNVAISLDGYIARPDGSYDWIVEDETIDFPTLFAQFDAFIMGRRTFETMLAQGHENPLKGKPRGQLAVVTSSAAFDTAHGDKVTILKSTAEAAAWVKQAKGELERDIWLFGGGTLCGCLLREKGLVDRVETAIMPVMLGQGIKMVGFQDENDPITWSLRLTGSERLGSGILMCLYDVVYSD